MKTVCLAIALICVANADTIHPYGVSSPGVFAMAGSVLPAEAAEAEAASPLITAEQRATVSSVPDPLGPWAPPHPARRIPGRQTTSSLQEGKRTKSRATTRRR